MAVNNATTNTDNVSSTDRQATGAQPDGTPVGGTPGSGGGGGSGTVTQVNTGTGLTGGPITTTGTISANLASSSVFGVVKVDGVTITASGGVISAVGSGSPKEIYVTDYATLALADTAANAIGAVLVLNTLSAAAIAVTSSITVVSPVRFAGATFTLSSGQVLTLSGGILSAPISKLFNGSGTVQLNAKTISAYAEWWGAGHTSSGDDGAEVNLAITACWNGSTQTSATFVFTNNIFYLQATILVNQPIPIRTEPGAIIQPSSSSPASIGMTVGLSSGANFNWRCVVVLPQFQGFSATGLDLHNCCLANITVGMIVSCSDGLILRSDASGQCLDNIITVTGIFSSADSAIKVRTTTSSAVIQGNYVYANFVNTCTRWVFFVQTGGGAGANNDNHFKTDAVDWTSTTSPVVIDNSAGFALTANIFEAYGFFAGGTSWNFGNGQIEACEFRLSTFPPLTNYGTFGFTETSTTDGAFGNRYDWGGMLSQNLTSSDAQTSAGSRGSYNSGTVVPFNRIKVNMGVTSLAAGGSTNFYIYSPMVLGNARLSFVPRAMAGCVCTNLSDNTSVNANEIKITVTNATSPSVTATLIGEVIIGIP